MHSWLLPSAILPKPMRQALLLLLLSYSVLYAQSESWNGLSFEHEVSPDWGYAFELEYRTPFSAATSGSYLFLLAGNRKLAKNLSLTAGSRYELGRKGEPSTLRVFSDLNFKLPLGQGPFTLESRLRYQQDRPPGEDGSLRRVAVRPRLGLALELTEKVSAVAEYEGRFRFDQRNEWSRLRWTTGLAYTASDRVAVEVFYRQEQRINVASERTDKIIGLYLDYTLPDRRKRDWDYRHPFGRQVTW